MQPWIIYAVVGWGLASWVIVRLSLPDPPPPMRWFVLNLAGIIGGAVGGCLVHASSDPRPGVAIVSAIAGAAVLIGAARTFLGKLGG